MDDHVLRKALDFEVECQREAEEDMQEAGLGESVNVDLNRKDALCRSKWSVGVN